MSAKMPRFRLDLLIVHGYDLAELARLFQVDDTGAHGPLITGYRPLLAGSLEVRRLGSSG